MCSGVALPFAGFLLGPSYPGLRVDVKTIIPIRCSTFSSELNNKKSRREFIKKSSVRGPSPFFKILGPI